MFPKGKQSKLHVRNRESAVMRQQNQLSRVMNRDTTQSQKMSSNNLTGMMAPNGAASRSKVGGPAINVQNYQSYEESSNSKVRETQRLLDKNLKTNESATN